MSSIQQARPVKRTVFTMTANAYRSENAMGYSQLKLTLLATLYNAMKHQADYVRYRERVGEAGER